MSPRSLAPRLPSCGPIALAAGITACAPAPIARGPLDPFHLTALKDFGAYRVSSNSADPADNALER